MNRDILPAHRRASLLATLYFEPSGTARITVLVKQLELVHGLVVSTDLVRADVTWLADVELAQVKDDVVRLTERGRDVAQGRAKFPGG
ncbi:MAG: hypothetical protein NTZ64_15210 [Polaromonas sp.]|nr:hypothetical protein [Polaromonas sp.]